MSWLIDDLYSIKRSFNTNPRQSLTAIMSVCLANRFLFARSVYCFVKEKFGCRPLSFYGGGGDVEYFGYFFDC